jgi:alpha-glucosidase (family GH31 glycosyl hydrolase)
MNMNDFHKWVNATQKTNLEMSDTQRQFGINSPNLERKIVEEDQETSPEMTDTDGEVTLED